MSMIETRKAQALLAAHIWRELLRETGPDMAARIMSSAIAADARMAGEDFAHRSEPKPSLAHFATVLNRWQEGGALTIEGIELTENKLSFTVSRCSYAEAYAELQLSTELGTILSCARDEPFAQGYSPQLRMERACTIMEGSVCCRFVFHWDA